MAVRLVRIDRSSETEKHEAVPMTLKVLFLIGLGCILQMAIERNAVRGIGTMVTNSTAKEIIRSSDNASATTTTTNTTIPAPVPAQVPEQAALEAALASGATYAPTSRPTLIPTAAPLAAQQGANQTINKDIVVMMTRRLPLRQEWK